MKNLDKFKGCLLGGAAEDALRYAVEFMDEQSIMGKYGPKGIISYDMANGKAFISDDTQMPLFTANGLFWETVCGRIRGLGRSYPSYIGCCYEE